MTTRGSGTTATTIAAKPFRETKTERCHFCREAFDGDDGGHIYLDFPCAGGAQNVDVCPRCDRDMFAWALKQLKIQSSLD